MTTSPTDHIRQIKADLLLWLEQNNRDGTAWFLDEGLPASAPAPDPGVAPVPDAPDSPAPAGNSQVPRSVPAAKPAARQVGQDPADPFDEQCRVFVERTLADIERQGSLYGPPAPQESPETALAVLKEQVLPCTSCPLHKSRNHTVFGAGNARAGVLFIGEAPGRDEDLQGEPFVGRSGQLLTRIIAAIGFSREDVYICNILKCRPPNNRDPLPEEVASCEPYLKQQLAIIRPRVICCLGRIAAQTLLKTTASLRSLRESVHYYEGIPVMATYHPAALLRNPGWKPETWNAVRRLRALHDALADQGTGEG